MPVLIFNRAVQGIGTLFTSLCVGTPDQTGASGMFVSILAGIAVVINLKLRAAFFGAFGYVDSRLRASATRICADHQYRLCRLERCRPTTRWCFCRASHVNMVFLVRIAFRRVSLLTWKLHGLVI